MSTVREVNRLASDVFALVTLGGDWGRLLESFAAPPAVAGTGPAADLSVSPPLASSAQPAPSVESAAAALPDGSDSSPPVTAGDDLPTPIANALSNAAGLIPAERHALAVGFASGRATGGSGPDSAPPQPAGSFDALAESLRSAAALRQLQVSSVSGSAAAATAPSDAPTAAASLVASTSMPAAQTAAASSSAAGNSSSVSSTTVSPSMILSFAGNNYTTNGTFKPDTSLAAGPNFLVTTENARVQWYDKNGNLLSDQGLDTFLNLPANVIDSDSRVVYDAVNNRFVMEVDEANNGSSAIGIAVSKDSNPQDGWYIQQINTNLTISGVPSWADFPGIATDGKAIYLTAEMRSVKPFGVPNALDPFQETHLWIINDGAGTGGLYDGGPMQVSDFGAQTVTGGGSTFFGQPAQILSPTPGGAAFLVNATGAGGVIQVVEINNPTNSPSFTAQNVLGGASSTGSTQVQVDQPGGPQIQVSATGNAVFQNGLLYIASTVLPTSGPDNGVGTVQWERLSAGNLGSLAFIDQGNLSGSAIFGNGTATYLPWISADPNGDFLINYDASGPSLFAGSYYVMHAAADAPGTVEATQALHPGQDTYALTDNNGIVRFGAYNGALDPANKTTFWLYNEYAAPRVSGQSGNWATQIGSVPAGVSIPPLLLSAADFDGDATADEVWRNNTNNDVNLWNFVTGQNGFFVQDLGPATPDWSIAGAADFSGDGNADILLRNISGQVALWASPPGSSTFTFQSLGQSTLDWTIQGTGDFSGDGNADILWRNNSGEVGLWASAPGTTSFSFVDLGPSTLDWSIVGTGDFSGDGNADILWRNTASGDVGLWASPPGSLGFSFQDLGISSTAFQILGIRDFSGDGKADVLWRNTITNDTGLWLSNPGSGVSFTWEDLGNVNPNWNVLSLGDFSGEGKASILWQNASSGDVMLWAANPYTPQGIGTIGPPWIASAATDFNVDGKADILWRDSGTGDTVLWDSNSASPISFSPLDLGVVSSSWVIQAGADFQGDGGADILWRNSGSGDVQLWKSAGAGAPTFTTQDLGVVTSDWTIQGAADFQHDGNADILWRNSNSGDVQLWNSTGGATPAFTAQDLGISTLDWSVQGIADFNGDGKSDILWRNVSGEVGLWASNASSNSFSFQDLGPSSNAWNMLAAADFTGDGKADILWRNISSGEVALWKSNPGPAVSFTFEDLGTATGLVFQAAGDFNGDGKAETLWRDNSGNLTVWAATPGPVMFTAHDLGALGPNWQL